MWHVGVCVCVREGVWCTWRSVCAGWGGFAGHGVCRASVEGRKGGCVECGVACVPGEEIQGLVSGVFSLLEHPSILLTLIWV